MKLTTFSGEIKNVEAGGVMGVHSYLTAQGAPICTEHHNWDWIPFFWQSAVICILLRDLVFTKL